MDTMILILIGLDVVMIALLFLIRAYNIKHNNDVATGHRYAENLMNMSMKALGDDFSLYQLRTDREIAELKKEITTKSNQLERANLKLIDELPVRIRKVIGHIEFTKPLDR